MKTKQDKDSYYSLNQWVQALNTIQPGVNVLSIDFHRKKVGKVKSIKAEVITTFSQPLPGLNLEQRTLTAVSWSHNGTCYQRKQRMKEFDLVDVLQQL